MRIWREVRHFAWHCLQRCCKMLFLLTSVVQNVCVCALWTSCLRAKIHYYYMWPFAKKLYHGWICTMTSSNETVKISPLPKWRAGCGPVPKWNQRWKFYPVLLNFKREYRHQWARRWTTVLELRAMIKLIYFAADTAEMIWDFTDMFDLSLTWKRSLTNVYLVHLCHRRHHCKQSHQEWVHVKLCCGSEQAVSTEILHLWSDLGLPSEKIKSNNNVLEHCKSNRLLTLVRIFCKGRNTSA